MVHSQNGWPAYATTDHFTHATACGFGFWAANDDVAVVFKEFIERFDVEVEPIGQPKLDDWSWANRLVRGSTSVVSNHGSATALDLNALKHPRGVRNTFPPAKAARVRTIKDEITDDDGRPVLRLGMDFATTVDDMHVEINATPAQVKQAADKIRARTQEEDVQLSDDVDLTPKAAELLGSPTATVRELLQWSPAVRAARNEIGVLRDQVGTQSKSLTLIEQRLALMEQTLAAILARLPASPTAP